MPSTAQHRAARLDRLITDAMEGMHADTKEHVNGKVSDSSMVPDLLRYLLNDHGNAERLIALSRDLLRYSHAFRRWMYWDEFRWASDTVDHSRKLGKQAMLEFLRQAIDAKVEAAENFARQSLNAKRIASMLSMAECEIFVTPDQLDQHPFILNFLNGEVDLRSGELHQHCREHYLTKLIHFNYRPGTPCQLFLATLARLMGAHPDASEAELERADRLISYLQKAFGYSLTGSTSEKAVFMLYGGGSNGKTTLLSLFLSLLEEYATLLQIDTLMVRQESTNAQADLADLRGARFVMTSETEEGQRLAEGKLKRISQGMGRIKAVRKYENPIEFDETHKLFMDCNHRPVVRGTDNAIWQRLHLIPFTVTIPPEEIDKELPAKLLNEAEGILAWTVAGAVRWWKEGLGRPPEVQYAAEEYRSEMDQIGRFIRECCIELPTAHERAKDLYSAYKAWAEEGGEYTITANLLGRKLAERGYQKRDTGGSPEYQGIAIQRRGNLG